jgi:hypothetical protein
VPPRYAYWTIIVDDQPTAFRAGALDDIMPTFNRLKEKQPTAKLMWFQSGKLWPSRIDAREAMQVRGERGRYSDPRQDGGDNTPSRERPKWKSKDFSSPRALKPSSPEQRVKPEWKPRSSSPGRSAKPEWKPKSSSESKPRPVGRPFMGRRSEGQDRPEWKPKSSGDRPEWKPKGAAADAGAEKRKWIPKAEYKKLTGTEARRDDKWRPGGEHKDPRQKYIDAKKAKWGRFKQAIRSRAKKKS